MKWETVEEDFMKPMWGKVVLKLFKRKVVIETLVPCDSLGKGHWVDVGQGGKYFHGRIRYTPYFDKITIPIPMVDR